MRPSLSIALLAALAVALAACDAERAGTPRVGSAPANPAPAEELGRGATQPRPACMPRSESLPRICGLAPPRRRVPEGTAHKLTTVAGESFWIVLPDGLAGLSEVVAVPSLPSDVKAELTTAHPRRAAGRYCDGFRTCEPVVVERETVPGGVLARWDDASGSIRDLEVSTVDIGPWTLVLSWPDAAAAERFVRALRWSFDDDGYPRVRSVDRDVPVYVDWAGVTLWVPAAGNGHRLIEIVPGCDESARRPGGLGAAEVGADLEVYDEPESPDGGRWCAAGDYWVEVIYAERPELERLHQRLTIIRD